MIISNHQTHIMGELGQISTSVFESCGKPCAGMYLADHDSLFFSDTAQIASLIEQLSALKTQLDAAIAAKATTPIEERIDVIRGAV
jgi:hypothetical protein